MKFIGTLIDGHLSRYPRMELADVYKLLHQAALGSGHAIESLAARNRLREEIGKATDGPEEPVVDPISPDGRLARVHLRAFVAAGYDLDELLEAFVKTAQSYLPSIDRLERFCGCVGDLAAQGRIPFSRDQAVDYLAGLAAAGYPVVRHSKSYRDAYRPAYRVVALDCLPTAYGRSSPTP
jgi:hypothetical protein